MGERCVRNAEVEGSTPFRSTPRNPLTAIVSGLFCLTATALMARPGATSSRAWLGPALTGNDALAPERPEFGASGGASALSSVVPVARITDCFAPSSDMAGSASSAPCTSSSLADLKSGKDFASVKESVDATVKSLIEDLRQQSRTVNSNHPDTRVVPGKVDDDRRSL